MVNGSAPPDPDSAQVANAPPGTVPPKKASAVLVRTADPPDIAYRTVARIVTARGYGVQSSDPSLRLVMTTFNDARNVGPVQLTAIVLEDSSGSVVQFTGVFKWSAAEIFYRGAGQEPQPIQYGGMSGSPIRKTWEELYSVASSYPGGHIEFRGPQR